MVTGVLAFALTLPALGHVGLEPREVTPGSSATISFRIGHGCDSEPTTQVSVQIPAGVASVRPFPKPGWELTVERGTLPAPINTGSGEITEGVTVVTWSGGSLEDAHTDVFEIRATVYGEPGDRVYFPVVQSCENGEHAWIRIPTGNDEPSEPAPGLTLASASVVSPDSEDNLLTMIALGVGALGLLVGGLALIRSRG